VLASEKRDAAAARRFFTRALQQAPRPVEVTTDKAAAYLGVLDELLPAARHVTERYGNCADPRVMSTSGADCLRGNGSALPWSA
jgi:transposase-like protein